MMKENEIEDLIAWGKEEKQPEFLEFVNFCRECRADRKTMILLFFTINIMIWLL